MFCHVLAAGFYRQRIYYITFCFLLKGFRLKIRKFMFHVKHKLSNF